jgi:mortality factor 4-like protein 1
MEVIEGLKLYFDRALGTLLLYKFERQQFLDLLKDKGESIRMSDVYGAEHLLRLFGRLSLFQLKKKDEGKLVLK